MRPRQAVPEPLRRLAGRQAGVVSREQALGCGLTDHVVRRLLTEGSWVSLAPGLYAVTPGPPPWEALAWGGVLLGGPHARLGPHRRPSCTGWRRRPHRWSTSWSR